MSIRLEMLQVARLAPRLLGDSTDLVCAFLRGQQNEDGGFKDRTGRSDLYYTVFGLEGLLALHGEPAKDRVLRFLESFGDGQDLDLVHLCCLARCWSATRQILGAEARIEMSRVAAPAEVVIADGVHGPISSSPPSPVTEGGVTTAARSLSEGILRRIESYRAADGGYHPAVGSDRGTVYATFLALGAYLDLRAAEPEPERLCVCLERLRTPDGGWANHAHAEVGATNTTAAAVAVLRHLRQAMPPGVGEWLLAQAHPQGGFRANPQAPMPDLLSTATALHSLSALGHDFARVRERCLDFVDSLWTNEGGFYGHWGDPSLDCEYTYYGLLALGHLSR